ncbi:WD40 repeat-like protein [Parathielavia appendiculata]|uniref:WD40 repeat-like protein n=1 Tax=Parathielavia appendiculata TaxID=2587402 RepID=A0AAN6TUN5_9PEZI|nr:WD40 repeat-like protein [Parathielavia appendiculata]
MNGLLFQRSLGILGPNEFARIQTTSLLTSFSAAPRLRFDGGERAVSHASGSTAPEPVIGDTGGHWADASSRVSFWAHQASVNALALERFDGRILISGGSDATIKLWDLEQGPHHQLPQTHTYRPVAVVARAGSSNPSGHGPSSAAAGHRFGITHLSFYPFDSAAFLSSSHDQTLKLWSTETASVSGTFHLGARVYTHATSPIASHLLVACGTQHPAVRLVDLRSSSAVQSLVAPGQIGGSAGAALSVAWSPAHAHVLASGSVDGAIRIWDVRRSNALVALLDQEDITGLPPITTTKDNTPRAPPRLSAKAHTGPVNSLTWTDDGSYLVSAGHDAQIRVWDAATGANTLANFGPTIRNSSSSSSHHHHHQMGAHHLSMFVSPVGLTPPRNELLFFPNETEILVMDLHEGNIVTRLRQGGMMIGPAVASSEMTSRGEERSVRNRVMSIVWRGAGGGGDSSGVVMGGSNSPGGMFSGHSDGQIRAWIPRLEGVDKEAEDGSAQEDETMKSKKRKVLDDAYRTLMGRQITFC